MCRDGNLKRPASLPGLKNRLFFVQVKENKYYQATYSRISPYADPAYESIEPYVEAAHSHLKPVSMNGKA